MRSNTKKVRKILVKAVVLGCLVSAGVALADGSGGSARPGGGYVEPIVLHPMMSDVEFGAGISSRPMHMAHF
jgi:hypothetical protein